MKKRILVGFIPGVKFGFEMWTGYFEIDLVIIRIAFDWQEHPEQT